jgi:hypothetical protein
VRAGLGGISHGFGGEQGEKHTLKHLVADVVHRLRFLSGEIGHGDTL